MQEEEKQEKKSFSWVVWLTADNGGVCQVDDLKVVKTKQRGGREK